MAIRFQIRGGSKAEWTSANPVLMERELGIELDTRQVKIGDGFNEWSNLPYMTQGDTGLTGKDGPKGEKGDPFVYSDFTEAQLLGLVGPQGPRGYKGDPFVYGDFTPEQLEGLRGPTGTVSNLDEWNIMDTLGYFPVSPTELNEHKNDLTNPHKTNKTHVGLGSVDNVKQATKVEFDAHKADNASHITSAERTIWDDKQNTLPAESIRRITFGTADPNPANMEEGEVYMQYE